MPDSLTKPKTVAVIGAGPVGLAAAAHLLERGLEPVVLEAGPTVGHAVRQWSHVQTFSPWEFNIDKAADRLLTSAGWNKPQPDHYPTGAELVEQYLEPLATRTPLKDRIRTSSRVTGIGRVGFDKVKTKGRETAPFEIRYENGKGADRITADAVIDASGTWFSPNPAGANGLQAAGEHDSHDRITYGMPDILGRDRARYAGRTVAVLGGGHSAVGTLIDLARLKEQVPATEVVWLLRATDRAKSFGGGTADQLKVRGALGSALAGLVAGGTIRTEAGFRVGHIDHEGERLRVATGAACCARAVTVDELIVATGFRPDLDFLRELRLSLDPALECPPILAPLIDPNEHSCGSVRPHGARELSQPEAGFYFAGMKSYGRAPTFLMMTGYEQVRSIAAEIAGDHEAAGKVELVLPETGVCNGPAPSASPADAASSCCAPAQPAVATSCCAPKAS
ncbi:NAD(P)-binding domain-containing protein [Reyranella aquatilis]|jgi:thioredoxin reductase|uniref:NAD(P)-binding domain-containing protein n=1 Tax=Reyranella aquatilis TaxID=2035356 RepID=A0ABS8KX33_9HYPH|nr:FAD-dependent oxidoreductase [Reyranella aquatilis]MCC8430637.1 NAD(P)-binding domain-containing protein [Reyranella aquatilis]